MKKNSCLFAIIFAFACSDSSDAEKFYPVDSATDAVVDSGLMDVSMDASGDSALDASEDSVAGDAAIAPTSDLVVNEIQASGGDWIELYNRADSVVDASGMKVADVDGDGPRVDGAFVFPANTMIAATQFVVIHVGLDTPMEGELDCELEGVDKCFQASWGISNGSGETIYLLGTDDAELDSVAYPADATEATHTWARIPDGSATLAVALPTPGATNMTAPN